MPFKFIDRLFAFLCVPIRSNIGSIGIEMIFCVNNRHPNIHKSSIQIRDIWVFNSKKSSNRWTCATISRFYWICDRLVTNSIQIGSWKHIEHDFLFASELTCDKKKWIYMFKEFEHSLQNDITIEFSIVDITMHNEESSREFAYSVSI